METVVYLPRKSYFLQYFASRRAAPQAPIRGPLFAESFSIIAYVLRPRSAIRGEHWCGTNPEEKFIESEGIMRGWERGATTLAVLLLIFTFPLIFTWTRGQTRYHASGHRDTHLLILSPRRPSLFVKTTLKSSKQNSLWYVSVTHASLRGHGTLFFHQNGYRLLM